MSSGSYIAVKRLIDVVGAGIGLLVTLPLQAAVAALVRARLGSPVIFKQARPGKDEQIFQLIKFRTMLEYDEDLGLVSDDERMTRLGAALRSTSLDELPSLWNVLVGEMSLVGPRPLLERYLGRYTPEQRRRHQVRPGVTGLAQVRGRNAISWEEKLALDVEYVEKMGLLFDLRILAATFGKVIRRSGISSGTSTTMEEFHGV